MRRVVPLLLLSAQVLAAPPKVALPGLTAIQIDEKLGEFVNDQLAQELSANGVDVVTPKEISALIGIEKQRQLLACNGESGDSCMAELASALGSDGVMVGDVARVGSHYQLTVKIVSATTGQRVADFTAGGDKEEALVTLAAEAAEKMAPELEHAFNKPLGPKQKHEVAAQAVAPAPPPSNSGLSTGVLLGGGVLLVAGVVFEGLAYGDYNTLRTNPENPQNADSLASRGKLFNTLGVAGIVTGVAAVGVGAVLKVTSKSGEASAALVPTGNGVALSGVFP